MSRRAREVAGIALVALGEASNRAPSTAGTTFVVMGAFEVVAEPGPRLSGETIREVGSVFGSYVDSDRQAPMHDAIADLIAEPMRADQLLNCVVGLANVTGLVILTLGQTEQAASDLTTGVVARSAHASTDGVFTEGPEDPLHRQAQAFIRRVFGTTADAEMPSEVDGRLLVALAAYGDAAVVLADRLGIPRATLGPALSEAAARM